MILGESQLNKNKVSLIDTKSTGKYFPYYRYIVRREIFKENQWYLVQSVEPDFCKQTDSIWKALDVFIKWEKKYIAV